jgi:acyl carrier protein
MKDIILKYIINEFGDNTPKEQRIKHYSYCLFPENVCTCEDLNEIDYNTSLITGGYIDSFSMVSVLVFLQDTFKIRISDSDATPENFNTVGKMVELVKKYI